MSLATYRCRADLAKDFKAGELYTSEPDGAVISDAGNEFYPGDPNFDSRMIRVFLDVETWLTPASEQAIASAVADFNKMYGPSMLSVVQMRRFCQILDQYK